MHTWLLSTSDAKTLDRIPLLSPSSRKQSKEDIELANLACTLQQETSTDVANNQQPAQSQELFIVQTGMLFSCHDFAHLSLRLKLTWSLKPLSPDSVAKMGLMSLPTWTDMLIISTVE